MSELQRDIERLYEFIKNVNVGFVMLFTLALYPVYMFGVFSDKGIRQSVHSIQYNAALLATGAGFIDKEKLTFGRICSGPSCEAYMTSAMHRQIAADARGTLLNRIIFSTLGLVVLMISASMWIALVIGIPGNGYTILASSFLMSILALPMMAAPSRPYEQRVCSDDTRTFTDRHRITEKLYTFEIRACVIVADRKPR